MNAIERESARRLRRISKSSIPHDPALTALEAAQARALGVDPDGYVAIPVQVQFDTTRPSGIGRGPDGQDVVIYPLMLAVPLAHVRMSRILGPDGQQENPLAGMLPTMVSRMIVPRAKLRPEVLNDLDKQQAHYDAAEADEA